MLTVWSVFHLDCFNNLFPEGHKGRKVLPFIPHVRCWWTPSRSNSDSLQAQPRLASRSWTGPDGSQKFHHQKDIESFRVWGGGGGAWEWRVQLIIIINKKHIPLPRVTCVLIIIIYIIMIIPWIYDYFSQHHTDYLLSVKLLWYILKE